MRVYIKNKPKNGNVSEQMSIILEYLRTHGELKIHEGTVEEFYCRFSDEIYSAGWMTIIGIDDSLLEEFAEYLNKIDL